MNQDQHQLISEASQVLQLEGHAGWEILVRDCQKAHDEIANTWCDIPASNSEAVQEARVTQLANRYIITALQTYKARLEETQLEVIHEENPEAFQLGDVDNNPTSDETGDEVYGT